MNAARGAWAFGVYQDQSVLEYVTDAVPLVPTLTVPTPNEIPGVRDLPGMPSVQDGPVVVGAPLGAGDSG